MVDVELICVAGVLFVLGFCAEKKAAGQSGTAQAERFVVSYAAVSGMFRCWMIGATAQRKAMEVHGTRPQEVDRKSTRLNSSHESTSRMPSSA